LHLQPSKVQVPASTGAGVFMKLASTFAAALALPTFVMAAAQDVSSITRMAENERTSRIAKKHFSYRLEERSPRTGGHLWQERVVEVDDGPVRRLMSIDGKALSIQAAETEQARLRDLANSPDEFRKANAASTGDEAHLIGLLAALPGQFILTPAGSENGCTRFAFRPDPAYQPSGMEQRVLHVMTGFVSLREPDDRLCSLEGLVSQPVTFGFGVLGRVDQGGSFRLERRPVVQSEWKSVRMTVHLQGKILLMKSLTRDQDAIRTEILEIPEHLTLAQAVALSAQ
jgi:hypothetical protein